jgi:protein-S-isoprenylcysteine O-methyltransferase Ste14
MSMPLFATAGLRLSWGAVVAYWAWSAHTVKATEQIEPRALRLVAYWLPLAIALLLLGPGEWFGHGALREHFVPHSPPVYGAGVALCLAGAALAIWSRWLLGSNWSSVVALKLDHELVEAGPYRYVRHPIYSGLLLLFLGNALLVGDWRGLLAVAIVAASFWRKLRVEEAWLTQRFGERYRDYMDRTRALVPGLL